MRKQVHRIHSLHISLDNEFVSLQRSAPLGYRVRIFHDGSIPSDPSLYIDPTALYDMGRTRSGSKAKKKKGKKNDPNMAQVNDEYVLQCTLEVAAKLGEKDATEFLSRAVRYGGMDVVTQAVDSALSIEEFPGQIHTASHPNQNPNIKPNGRNLGACSRPTAPVEEHQAVSSGSS